ncbi:MAG: hypothetical protein LRY55_11635, partial [Leadbetterella sp.]|nr:hypothetical protein [Leadbetterella sp.]
SGLEQICKGVPVGFRVDTRSPSTQDRFRIEFTTGIVGGDNISAGVHTPDKERNIWVTLPAALENTSHVYCRAVREADGYASEWLYLQTVTQADRVWSYLNPSVTNGLKLSIYTIHDVEFFNLARLTTVVVNGQELRQGREIQGQDWILPIPQGDTSFVISRVSTSCGNLPFSPDKIDFVKERSVFYQFSADKAEYCEGEEVEIAYTLSDSQKLDNIEPYAVINFDGYRYEEATGEPSWEGIYIPSLTMPLKIDRDRGVMSVQIPSDLYKLATASVKEKAFYILNTTLTVAFTFKNESVQALYGHDFNAAVRFRPSLRLAASGVNSSPGRAEIPVQFRGRGLRYELSNGQKGEIVQRLEDCSNCQLVLAGETSIRVPVQDDTVITGQLGGQCLLRSGHFFR